MTDKHPPKRTTARRTRTLDPAFSPTVAHGLAILEAFQAGAPLLSNRDLAQHTGLSKATVSRLTYTLMHKGLLQYDRQLRRYRLGSRVLSLSYPLLADMPLRQLARPHMRALAAAVDGSVSLGLYDQCHMTYIETARGHDLVAFRPDIGARLPVLASAMGRAWLASASEAQRDAVLRQIADTDPEQIPRHGAALARARVDLNTHGYCISEGEWQVDVHAAAVPLDMPMDGETVVFNCGIRVNRLGASVRQSVAPQLLAMVRAIARQLREEEPMHDAARRQRP